MQTKQLECYSNRISSQDVLIYSAASSAAVLSQEQIILSLYQETSQLNLCLLPSSGS